MLAKVEYALNNSVNKSTGKTPSKLLFGIEQRGNIQDALKEYLVENSSSVSSDLHKIRSKTKSRIETSQAYNENYYNKHRQKQLEYELGGLVMIKNFENTPGVSKKLIPRFKGPYEVVTKLRNDRYVVADVEGFQNT